MDYRVNCSIYNTLTTYISSGLLVEWVDRSDLWEIYSDWLTGSECGVSKRPASGQGNNFRQLIAGLRDGCCYQGACKRSNGIIVDRVGHSLLSVAGGQIGVEVSPRHNENGGWWFWKELSTRIEGKIMNFLNNCCGLLNFNCNKTKL